MSLLGCTIIVTGVLISTQPHLASLYIGLGICLGTGGCICAITGVLHINKQFSGSSRGLAHGFSLAGNTIGGLLLPGLIALMLDKYGFSWAMLIHAALILNIVPASLVFSSDKNLPVIDANNGDDVRKNKDIFKNPRLWFCIFSMASTTVGYTNFGLYLPLHLHSTLNLSKTTAASFISIFAVGDLLGRLLGPTMSDKWSPRWTWYCAGLSGAGTAMLVLPILSDIVMIGAVTLVAGLCSGVMVGVYPALLSDELGPENLSLTYPLSQTLAGILNLGGPPLLGAMASMMSTTYVMIVLGSSLIVGSLPLFIASLVSCTRKQNSIT